MNLHIPDICETGIFLVDYEITSDKIKLNLIYDSAVILNFILLQKLLFMYNIVKCNASPKCIIETKSANLPCRTQHSRSFQK